ncbi:MAG: hypothetical protein ACKO96_14620 [Flammeovirgaceae bacterium]
MPNSFSDKGFSSLLAIEFAKQFAKSSESSSFSFNTSSYRFSISVVNKKCVTSSELKINGESRYFDYVVTGKGEYYTSTNRELTKAGEYFFLTAIAISRESIEQLQFIFSNSSPGGETIDYSVRSGFSPIFNSASYVLLSSTQYYKSFDSSEFYSPVLGIVRANSDFEYFTLSTENIKFSSRDETKSVEVAGILKSCIN